MAFNKKMKVNDKWYPKSVLVGPVITTDQVTKHLAVKLMVCPSDVRVVLTTLSGVMDDYMAQRCSVKFDGIGSFYFTAATNNNGMRVRFIPTIRFCGVAREIQVAVVIVVRGLTDVDIEWEEWKGEVGSDDSGSIPSNENIHPNDFFINL